MAFCTNCSAEFTFTDVLKAFNPASIKCSGCSERIRSSYGTLVVAVVLFAALCLAFWSTPVAGSASGGLAKIGFLAALGLAFEFGYFYALRKGFIKSNLAKPDAQA